MSRNIKLTVVSCISIKTQTHVPLFAFLITNTQHTVHSTLDSEYAI